MTFALRMRGMVRKNTYMHTESYRERERGKIKVHVLPGLQLLGDDDKGEVFPRRGSRQLSRLTVSDK